MKIEISDVKQVGQIAKLTRKAQGLEQVSVGIIRREGKLSYTVRDRRADKIASGLLTQIKSELIRQP